VPEHSPALIAAAKAIELRVFGYDHPDDRICAALCEALSTTLPNEEAMKVGNDICPKCLSAHPVTFDCALPPILPTPKPEPTDDYLRRACDLLNAERASRGMRPNYDAERAGDREFYDVQVVARLLAEREAMQARVEVPRWVLAELYTRGWQDHQRGKGSNRDSAVERSLDLIASMSPEPTPDPDLVLAREATDAAFPSLIGRQEWHRFYDFALRALKLKGQAHE